MSRRIIVVLVLLALIGGGVWAWRRATARTPKPHVGTTTPSRGEFVVSLATEGALQSDDAMPVRTGKAPGQITMIVPDGTVIKAGDVFCRVESRELERKLTDAELANKQAQEEIEKAKDSAEEEFETAQRAAQQAEKDFADWETSTGIRTRQAEAQLEYDRAEAERLRTEYERVSRMATRGYAAGSEADLAKAAFEAQQFKVEQSVKDLDLSRRQVESERLQKQGALKAAQQRVSTSRGRIGRRVTHATNRAEAAAKELATVREAMTDTTIMAPMSGTVSVSTTYQGGERRAWREGDQVRTGEQLGTISGSENMSIRCRVKESSIAALKKGQQAEIDFDALSGRMFEGVVSTVGAVAREVWVWEDPTAEANERVFDVVVSVRKRNGDGLRPGLNGRVRIILKRLQDRIFVPLDAVTERDGKSFVYVKRGDGFARREVRTGDRNDVAVVILSGLSGNDVIALSDPTRLMAPARKGR